MAKLSRPFYTPANTFEVVAGGTLTCAASTTNTITTAGLVSTDIILCFPTVLTTMTTTFKAVYASATTITVTSSAATLTSDKLFWIVLRAAA